MSVYLAQGIGLQIVVSTAHSPDMGGLTNHKRLKDPNDKEANPWFAAAICKGQFFRYTPSSDTGKSKSPTPSQWSLPCLMVRIFYLHNQMP